jgi:T4 bacteriophage base plate protein
MSDKQNFYQYLNNYEFNAQLPGSKQDIEFRPINTADIKKLLTFEGEQNYAIQEKAIDDLISSAILTEGFKTDNLYIYDRLYLLMEIRKKTKGEMLEYEIKCPECKSQSLNRTDLNTLECKVPENLDNRIVDLGPIKVHLRHMTRGHQRQDIKSNMFPKKASDTQIAYMFQVLFHACAIDKIETPNGIDENIPITDRMYFIENIPMGHMEKIKEVVEDMEFGWKLENKITCMHCGYSSSEKIPIQQNFFF